MRSTVVPAQVTTVEDKIAGRLGLSQILLLTIPIFGGSAAFVILPPFFNYAIYKIALIIILVIASGILAIRIKGKILLTWISIAISYNLRPQYYVFNKNTDHLRYEKFYGKLDSAAKDDGQAALECDVASPLSVADRIVAERIIENPDSNVHYKTDRRGRIRVYVTES
jgi:hypothetical protein